ncbi:protein kinase C delta type-like [Pelobates fuscus]|uniref:protein kinase C delta type-like n=1 Tax=Pelobates fuscus TaxID=191477 RepID=UPI002FE43EF5
MGRKVYKKNGRKGKKRSMPENNECLRKRQIISSSATSRENPMETSRQHQVADKKSPLMPPIDFLCRLQLFCQTVVGRIKTGFNYIGEIGRRGKKRPISERYECPKKRIKRSSPSKEQQRGMLPKKAKRSFDEVDSTENAHPCSKRKMTKVNCSKHSRVTAPTSLVRFSFHCELGRGSFGQVLLATDVISKQKMAVKMVKKRCLLKQDKEAIHVERRVLEVASGSPFLTHAFSTFQTKDYLIYVLEYLSGGNLWNLISEYSPLIRSATRFIAAEIVCGLKFLHSKGILHRDIKPENIMLDGEGHVKIADFGLAWTNVFGESTKSSVGGTMGYVAPEAFLGRNLSASVDWFAFGAVLYEMLTGNSPFDDGVTDERKIVRSVVYGTPKYPEWLTAEEKDILQKLLCKDPYFRLGVASKIESHPFLSSIDWNEVQARRATPPPELQDFHHQKARESHHKSENKKSLYNNSGKPKAGEKAARNPPVHAFLSRTCDNPTCSM